MILALVKMKHHLLVKILVVQIVMMILVKVTI